MWVVAAAQLESGRQVAAGVDRIANEAVDRIAKAAVDTVAKEDVAAVDNCLDTEIVAADTVVVDTAMAVDMRSSLPAAAPAAAQRERSSPADSGESNGRLARPDRHSTGSRRRFRFGSSRGSSPCTVGPDCCWWQEELLLGWEPTASRSKCEYSTSWSSSEVAAGIVGIGCTSLRTAWSSTEERLATRR